MNLRDLHYFVTVADLGHFGKAALACHVSQPTLSMQIRKLEEFLGVPLLERTHRQVMLTPAGQELVERARSVVEGAAQIVHYAAAARDPLSGTLRLGLFPTLAPYFLPWAMPELRARFPRLELLLVEEKTPDLIAALRHGALDAAILALPIQEKDLRAAVLFEEAFLLAVPEHHAFARRKTVPLDALSGQSMLLLDEGHCLRDQALQVCQAIGVGEAQHFRATSLETLRHMVAAGGAVTLIPQLAARAGGDGVRYIPFRAHAPTRTIGLCWRASSARVPLFDALAGLIRPLAARQGLKVARE